MSVIALDERRGRAETRQRALYPWRVRFSFTLPNGLTAEMPTIIYTPFRKRGKDPDRREVVDRSILMNTEIFFKRLPLGGATFRDVVSFKRFKKKQHKIRKRA